MSLYNISCTRRLNFCAGHRVMNHEGKCRNLHGHEYSLEIQATAKEQDSLGRIVDFSVIKQVIGGWVEANWDHGFILCRDDSEAIRAVSSVEGQRLYLLPDNPTAENIARFLLFHSTRILYEAGVKGIYVNRVVVHETPNCSATVEYPPKKELKIENAE